MYPRVVIHMYVRTFSAEHVHVNYHPAHLIGLQRELKAVGERDDE